MAQTNLILQLTRLQIEKMSAELFVALGPGAYDPYWDLMQWTLTDQQYTWIVLQHPELQSLKLQNDKLLPISNINQQ